MTILNITNDGNYPEFIVVCRVIAKFGPLEPQEVVRLSGGEFVESAGRLRAIVARWTELGLFQVEAGKVRLSERAHRKARTSIDDFTDTLPGIARSLLLDQKAATPLWGKEEGISSDFARALAWLLSQDIYAFPSTWNEVNKVESRQVSSTNPILVNDTRWNGLRPWSRYLGFAVMEGEQVRIDPTIAIREVATEVLASGESMTAADFVEELAARLPVLDNGAYRRDVEATLDPASWKRPPSGQLSMSLSLALMRLERSGSGFKLENRADAKHGFTLSGRSHRPWHKFTHVSSSKS